MNRNRDQVRETEPNTTAVAPSGALPAPRRSLGRGLAVAIVLLFLASGVAGVVALGSSPHAVAPIAAHAPLGAHGVPLALGSTAASTPGTASSVRGIAGGLLQRALPQLVDPAQRFANPFFGMGSSGLPSQGPRALPLAGSPSNWYVTNSAWSGGGSTAVGGSATTLVTASSDYGPEANASSTTFLATHGIVGISRSTNGGASWTTNWPGQATAWTTSGNPAYGDVWGTTVNPDMLTQIFRPLAGTPFELWNSEPTTFPAVVSNASGGDLLMAATFSNACNYEFTPAATCFGTNAEVNTTDQTAAGIAVVRSTDGGVSWGTPVPVFSKPQYRTIWYSNSCPGVTGTGLLLLPANQTFGFSLAMGGPAPGGKNYAYLALAVLRASTAPKGFFCDTISGYMAPWVDYTSASFALEVSTSSDGGATWPAPVVVANVTVPTASLDNITGPAFPISPNILAPHLTVGPAPTYTVHGAYVDEANLTTLGLFPIAAFTNATATTWNAVKDLGISTYAPDGSNPDWLFNGTIPMITADNWSASPYKGDLYLVWNDNQTSAPGTPAILFSANRGASWSTPVAIASGGGLRYFNPSVSIQSNGTIWVDFYGVNPSNGYYRVYGIFSTDSGASWSGIFPITDQVSTPNASPSAQYVTGIGSIVATAKGAYAFWSDCRSADCTTGSVVYNWTVYVALVHAVSVSATNAPGAQATITLGGSSTTYNLPVKLGWDTNASITASVTAWIVAANKTWIEEFSSFSGATVSTSDPATFTYVSGDLVAHYTAVPGSWIAGTLTPAVAGAVVSVVDPIRGTIAVALTTASGHYTFNITVPGGQAYMVSASAPKYTANSQTATTTQFKTFNVDFVLPKIAGWIAGTVSTSTGAAGLPGAIATINGTAIAPANFDRTTGKFNQSEPWGTYYLNVSEPGYLALPSAFLLVVNPGSTAVAFPQLKGAWINGTVSPGAGVTVLIGTAAAPLSIQGTYATFNFATSGGTYEITAHKQGYSSFDQFWTLNPGGAKSLTINLTNRGYITGYIKPSSFNGNAPFITVNGVQSSVSTTGFYNVSIKAQALPIPVVAALAGYNNGYANATVGAGNVSWENFSLIKTPTGCTGPSCPCTVNCNSTPPPPPPPFSTLAIVGIGIAIVLVAVVAAVLLLMRKGKGGDSASEEAEPTADEAPTEATSAEPAGEAPPSSGM
ncbi:MAG: glycoside hydrolase [Thermoplasmata archaeon]|nr:glycoside hydrolase [Thermoplasmata archaeon]